MKNPRILFRFSLVVFFVGVALQGQAQLTYTPYAFTNFAGQAGVAGPLDGIGNGAQFDIPHSAAVDAAGNIYISDTFNHTIRRITQAGAVTTIVGTPGNKGYVDGVGTAQSAQFNSPIGLGADSNGNLYLADNGNQTIRKITPAGVVTTVAGQVGVKGNANGANGTFNSPNSVAVDSYGNIFVSDLVNRTIRKIAIDGTVSLFAGTNSMQGTNNGVGTLARFQAPEGLAIDHSDNLYVADQGASTIRKIAPDGTVTTLAGLGKTSGTNDGVGNLAQFHSPEAVAVDANGNVYVSDTVNNTIRKITPDGTVTTLAGAPGQSGSADGTNGTARFNVPRGIALDRANNVYVADSGNSTIRKLSIAGTNCAVITLAGTAGQNGSVDATMGDARFHFVSGLATDAAGNIYGVDRSNDDVRKITPAGVVTTLAGVSGVAGSTDGSGAAAQLYAPEQLAIDSATNIYVVEFFNNTVRKISPNGTNWVITTIAGCPACAAGTNDGIGPAARFNSAFGLTIDNNGNVYVADTGNRTVRKISLANSNVVTLAGTSLNGAVVDGTGTNAHFAGPLALAANANGIYVADSSSIRKVTFGGTVTTLAGCLSCASGAADGTGTNVLFSTARGIALDQAGNLYVAESQNNLVRKLTLSGTNYTVTTLGGSPGSAATIDGSGATARFNQPSGITVDNSGNVYVVNSGSQNIVKGSGGSAPPPSVQFDTSAGSLVITNNLLKMNLTGSSGSQVIIDASTNLTTWTPIQTNTLPFTFSADASGSKTFFRARLAQ